MKITDLGIDLKTLQEGWDGNLYVDEAAYDKTLRLGADDADNADGVDNAGRSYGKRNKLHMLAVGIGAHSEMVSGYEAADVYRILDWTGICFSNDLNNHGENGRKRNKDGRITGYWKILGALAHGLVLSVLDRLERNLSLRPRYVWVCTQTYKYMTIADREDYKALGVRPLALFDEEHLEGIEGIGNGTMYESRVPKIELSQDEISMVPEAKQKKQRIGKMMRNILKTGVELDADTIERVMCGEVLEITRRQSIDTTPFWDWTMEERQIEKCVVGLAELYSRNPRII